MIVINKKTFQQMAGNPNNYSELQYVKYSGIIPKCDVKYMLWNADFTLISEMSTAQKSALDLNDLNAAKSAKRGQIKTVFKETIAAGYFDSIENITVAIDDKDRNDFAGLETMMRIKSDTGEPFPAVPMTDIDGNEHILSCDNAKSLILRIGLAYMSLFSQRNATYKSIQESTTIEAIELIEFEL